MTKIKILLITICIMVMSTMTVSANAFDDLKDDLKDDQALKLAAGYLVANEVQRLTKISALELFLASTAVNYMDDKDLTNAVVKMTIGEISQEIGLSADTLRYYEKIGLLPNVPRDNSGKRNYDENFINWIKFIQTLKNSGMSLNDIIEYINLAKCGNNTYQERKNLLIKSKQILLEKMSNLQSMIEKANYQINNYDNILVPKTDALIF